MKAVNFFDHRWYSEHTSESLFYLYDREDSTMAKLSTDVNDGTTSVNVHNPKAKDILFLPVDHNLNIKKNESEDLESTCDYLLTVNDIEQILFGEIKTGRKGWASEGMKQIEHTIDIFRANHDLKQWSKCRAYVSNWHKWNARTSTRCVEETFRSRTGGLRLYIQNDVNIESEEH